VVPVTVAVNRAVVPAPMLADVGVTLTAIGGITVTVALADFEVSATLVATTWNVPAAAGAL
jgi:hypothetical protein